MPRIIGGIWGILFLLLVCVFPADSQDEKNPLVQELFAKSGLDQLIERLPMIVQQGLHQAFAQDENLKKLPAQTLEEIMDAAASAYESQKLRNIMLRSFAGKMDDAEIILVAFGTAARVALEALEDARDSGVRLGLIRPITLWPFPVDAFDGLENARGILTVEMNNGQMVEDVRLAINGRLPMATKRSSEMSRNAENT